MKYNKKAEELFFRFFYLQLLCPKASIEWSAFLADQISP